MKPTLYLLTAGTLLLFAKSASAVSYSTSVFYGSPLTGTVLTRPNSIKGTFDLLSSPGYTLGTALRDAAVVFTFSDGNGGSEGFSVYLGNNPIPVITSTSINNGSTTYTSLGANLDETASNDLLADGKLSFVITATSGTFNVLKAFLSVESVPPVNVPESGSSVTLLGLGLSGLVITGRHRTNRRIRI